jgi:hypothetical protein
LLAVDAVCVSSIIVGARAREEIANVMDCWHAAERRIGGWGVRLAALWQVDHLPLRTCLPQPKMGTE